VVKFIHNINCSSFLPQAPISGAGSTWTRMINHCIKDNRLQYYYYYYFNFFRLYIYLCIIIIIFILFYYLLLLFFGYFYFYFYFCVGTQKWITTMVTQNLMENEYLNIES
jgi:hypothetical protein